MAPFFSFSDKRITSMLPNPQRYLRTLDIRMRVSQQRANLWQPFQTTMSLR